MLHSKVVGGSTAKRVINCPASVALVAKMPPKGSSDYANEGTMLHEAIADYWVKGYKAESYIGFEHAGKVLTRELFEDKFLPAIQAMDEIDPAMKMQYEVETSVGFDGIPELEGVFGTTDFLGRIDNIAYVIDWKFGDGVYVEAEENNQLMFYAAAAMRTPKVAWVFAGVEAIEMIIVQPKFGVSSWRTTPKRIALFERDLIDAVKKSERPDARFATGDWCRWCAAKAVCPIVTGAVDRALQTQIEGIDKEKLAYYLDHLSLIKDWMASVEELAQQVLEHGGAIEGYKLVEKRATKAWADEEEAEKFLSRHLDEAAYIKTSIITPTQAEKLIQNEVPQDLLVKKGTAYSVAKASDKRPPAISPEQRLASALKKLTV